MLTTQLNDYIRQFDRVQRNARALTVGLSDEQVNWRPEEDRWSIAECFEHCRLMAEQVFPGVEAALRHAKEYGPFDEGPFTYGPVSRLFIRSVRPSTMRMPSPSGYVPARRTYRRDETVNAFCEMHDRWIAAIRRSERIDLRRVHAPSSAIPMLRLPIGAWYEAIPLHSLRHLEQAQRVMQAPGFPVRHHPNRI